MGCRNSVSNVTYAEHGSRRFALITCPNVAEEQTGRAVSTPSTLCSHRLRNDVVRLKNRVGDANVRRMIAQLNNILRVMKYDVYELRPLIFIVHSLYMKDPLNGFVRVILFEFDSINLRRF